MDRDNRWLVILLAVLVLIVVLGTSFGAGMMGPGMMRPGMMWRYGPPGGEVGGNTWAWGLAMGLGWLAMLAFWGAVIVGLVLLIRWFTGTIARPGAQESALEILKRRYAAGEITREEYEQMRQVVER